MRIVDTSALVERLLQSTTGQALRSEFPARTAHLVPAIVQFELAVWARRELGDTAARHVIADTTRCMVAPMDSRIALRAAEVRHEGKLATADALINATVIASGADLLTCDAHLELLPHAVCIPKS